MKPYQKDLAFLQTELCHHEYMARKYTQEYKKDLAQEFTSTCADIHAAIQTVKKRQAAAVSEWSALTMAERQSLLMPVFNAAEEAAARIRTSGCPEFAHFLEEYLNGILMDLYEFKE